MTQQNRDRQERERNNRERNQDDWAQQVPWERGRGPYEDYGWERDQSVLPEFRDPDVHRTQYDRQEADRWRQRGQGQQQGQRQYQGQQRGQNMKDDESGPYKGIGPKGYQRADDRIMEDVCERLTRHGWIDARNMQVQVQNGEVTLTGMVPDRQMKRMAETVADKVRGVKDIHNQLRIGGQQDDSGMPGGGQGRVDQVGRSGVYPASGPMPQGNAPVQGEASWGQGERGSAGYEDSGRSEIQPGKQNRGKNQP